MARRRAGHAAAPVAAGKNLLTHVLIVDDEPQVRGMLAAFFGDAGYNVVEAEDGLQGLDLAKRLQPRMILLDVAMPGMNGIETLRRLRSEVPSSEVVMISGHADEKEALRSLELGAKDFIQKPFDLEHLKHNLLVRLAGLD